MRLLRVLCSCSFYVTVYLSPAGFFPFMSLIAASRPSLLFLSSVHPFPLPLLLFLLSFYFFLSLPLSYPPSLLPSFPHTLRRKTQPAAVTLKRTETSSAQPAPCLHSSRAPSRDAQPSRMDRLLLLLLLCCVVFFCFLLLLLSLLILLLLRLQLFLFLLLLLLLSLLL